MTISISDKMSTAWTFVSDMPSNDTLSFLLFVVAAACLNEWAWVHYLAMGIFSGTAWIGNGNLAMTMNFGPVTGVDYLAYELPVHTGRVYIQHGLNLGLAGFFAHMAIVGMIFNFEAAPLIAFVPYLVDVAYFIAFDLPHLGPLFAEA